LEWIVVAALSILWHELGHALAFRRFGHEPAIELLGMGGLTHSLGGSPLTLGQSALVSFAGPCAGFLLALAVYLVALSPTMALPDSWGPILVGDLLWINAGWGAVNLLPILPLDGGHILRAGLRSRFPERADQLSWLVSIGVGAVASMAAYLSGLVWAAYVVGWCALSNLIAWRDHKRVTEENAQHEALVLAWDELKNGDGKRAEETARAVLAKPWSQALVDNASHLLCLARLQAGNSGGAWSALLGVAPERMIPEILTQVESALFQAGLFAEAFEASELHFARVPSPDVAYNAACAAARKGNKPLALQWLRKAISVGYADRAHLEADTDLASLHGEGQWADILNLIKDK
jgi:Zn-dependent protease